MPLVRVDDDHDRDVTDVDDDDDDDDDDDGGGGGGGGDDDRPPRPPTTEIVQDCLCFTQCRKPFPTTSCQERAVAGCSTPRF